MGAREMPRFRRVAHVVSGALRAGSTLGRLGGDEFVVIAPGADQGAALGVARRVADPVARAFAEDGFELTLTVGTATCPPGPASVNELLNLADRNPAPGQGHAGGGRRRARRRQALRSGPRGASSRLMAVREAGTRSRI